MSMQVVTVAGWSISDFFFFTVVKKKKKAMMVFHAICSFFMCFEQLRSIDDYHKA